MKKRTPKDSLSSFLDAHYFSEEKETLLSSLNDLCLYEAFNKTITHLREENDLGAIISNTFLTVISKLGELPKVQRSKSEKQFIGLFYRILLDYYKKSPHTAAAFVKVLDDTLKTVCKMHDYNHEALSEHFDFPRMRFSLEQIAKNVPFVNSPYFTWTGTGDLNIFVHELIEKRKIVKTKSDLENLFEYEKFPDAKVQWKREYDDLLVWLFSELIIHGCIKVRGRFAPFIVIERQFRDFSDRPFKNKTLRNKCSEINTSGDKHKVVISEVNLIIAAIKPPKGQ